MKRKNFSYLTDPEVGRLYYEDADRKYKDITARDMLFALMCECADRIYDHAQDVTEQLPDGSERVHVHQDVTMYRVYHTLQQALRKLDAEAVAEAHSA